MSDVLACIDGSPATQAVCDYAAWASRRLDAALTLLHVLDPQRYPQQRDFSGSIGLGSREHLLDELALLDQQRHRLAMEQGRLMLEAARDRVHADGVAQVQLRQRHGDLLDNLLELQDDTRLLVIGRQGARSSAHLQQLGSHLESVIRAVQRPILVSCGEFKAPQSYLLAYDGSPTAQHSLQRIAASPLLQGLPCHLLLVGNASDTQHALLEDAAAQLAGSASQVSWAIRQGDVEQALPAYQAEQQLDLLVMGAYGHSRLRQFLLGSTTSALLASSQSPLLILR